MVVQNLHLRVFLILEKCTANSMSYSFLCGISLKEVGSLYSAYMQRENVARIHTPLQHNCNSIQFQFISMQSS